MPHREFRPAEDLLARELSREAEADALVLAQSLGELQSYHLANGDDA